ncbi:MAG: NAD-dependent epimerase/dehydratase family protein [Fuerstiella sp.]|nr:NAD-dependent epimerase/dehydratase family protein [Fuerstiella sp.]
MAENPQRILITGGYGCIGSETTKWLIRNTTATVVVCSRKVSEVRTERVFHDVDRSRLSIVEVDVTDQDRLAHVLNDHAISRVVHLAALQTPDCDAHRDLGLQINLGGTQNLIEAMKASELVFERYIFASSIAVYGPRAAYPSGCVPMLAEPMPVNVYGAWKLAGEQISRYFWEDTHVPTLCLRPGVLFGPGRDAGLTASPTTALKCVALGLPFEIPFYSPQDYLYAPDVGAAFGSAVTQPFDGYGVFTLPGRTLETREIVTTMRQAAIDLGMSQNFGITIGQNEVPFICDLEDELFQVTFSGVRRTPLDQAIHESLQVFTDQVRRGWLTRQNLPK